MSMALLLFWLHMSSVGIPAAPAAGTLAHHMRGDAVAGVPLLLTAVLLNLLCGDTVLRSAT